MQALGTGHQRAGRTSRIVVEGLAVLAFASWDIDEKTQDLDTVNFESYNVAAGESFDEGIMSTIGCDIRAGGDWDAGTNPKNDPPGLFPRDDLQQEFVISRIDGDAWNFPFSRIRSARNGAQVRGKVTFEYSGHSQGPYTDPAGEF